MRRAIKHSMPLVALVAFFLATAAVVAQEKVEVGVAAPNFTASTEDEKVVELKDYLAEKNVVLVFVRAHW